MICPKLKGNDHTDPSQEYYQSFTIGDIEPNGPFVHVLNDITLDIVMKELDTITDFTDYLEEKTKFIRSGHLGFAAGEEDLLAYYLTHMVSEEKHGFSHPEGRDWKSNDVLALDKGNYDSLKQNPQYLRKKKEDEISYIWDSLIGAFTKHMLEGTSIVPTGSTFKIEDNEAGVRYMAQESRFMRRLLGGGVWGVLESANKKDKTFRAIIRPEGDSSNETCYVFMTLAHPRMKLSGGYQQYRQARIKMLEVYCMGILEKYRYLSRVVGIATEPPPLPGKKPSSSEDMIIIEQPVKWTRKMKEDLSEDCRKLDLFKDGRVGIRGISIDEYSSDDEDQ